MDLIWHLAHTANWDRAVETGEYTTSTRGATLAQVGFVHASYGHQLARVAAAVHGDDAEPLIILGIDTDALASQGIEVRDEPGDPSDPDGERFPHIYGPVPVAAVVETHPAEMVDGALQAPTWDPGE